MVFEDVKTDKQWEELERFFSSPMFLRMKEKVEKHNSHNFFAYAFHIFRRSKNKPTKNEIEIVEFYNKVFKIGLEEKHLLGEKIILTSLGWELEKNINELKTKSKWN